MATRFDSTLVMDQATDAQFQGWTQFIDLTLVTTGGWTHTADTGQVNLATVAHPAAVSTFMGYKVYAMADALQATAPIIMRIDYGSDSAAAINPQIKVTIGTGSDGAGNITGTLLAATLIGPHAASASACSCFGSASTNRVQLMMFTSTNFNNVMVLSIERTKDATGADTGDGLLITYTSSAVGSGINSTQYLNCAVGTQPPVEVGVSVVLSNQTTSGFSANIGIGVVLHFKGTVQQPGMGVVVTNSGDFLAGANMTFSMYGANHTFQLGLASTAQLTIPTGSGASAARTNSRIGIRYE